MKIFPWKIFHGYYIKDFPWKVFHKIPWSKNLGFLFYRIVFLLFTKHRKSNMNIVFLFSLFIDKRKSEMQYHFLFLIFFSK